MCRAENNIPQSVSRGKHKRQRERERQRQIGRERDIYRQRKRESVKKEGIIPNEKEIE